MFVCWRCRCADVVEAGAVRDQHRGQCQTVLAGGDVERRAVLAGAAGTSAHLHRQQTNMRQTSDHTKQSRPNIHTHTHTHTHTHNRPCRGWFSRKLHETCLCESARPVETGGKPDFLRIDRLRDTRRTASALAWRRAVKSGRSRLQGPRPKSRIQLLKFNKEIYV